MRDGTLPGLEQVRREGALHTITTVFPSVTGPAYVPFLLGRHPGLVGLPGLRWYDRSRTACRWPGHARSYVGAGLRHVDRDLDPGARTLFELAGPGSVGALSVIGRGLSGSGRVGHGALFAARAAATHFRGDVRGWLAIDRLVSDTVVRRVHARRPAFTFAAFTGVDKASHAAGHGAPVVREAMRIVDTTVGRIRENAERGGYWASLHLWVVSDHGHSSVSWHDDLHAVLRTSGYRVLAHPWAFRRNPDVALMVSGNAMAHLYLMPRETVRRFWPTAPRGEGGGTSRSGARSTHPILGQGASQAIPERWHALVEALLERPSVDLLLLPRSPTACEIRARGRGAAALTWTDHSYAYYPETGDPLGLGTLIGLDADAAYAATLTSDYPDALVQIASLCASPRSGDVILSAARRWDFRARYEPIPHVSSHGALHREHMLVPLLTNRPTAGRPRRTVDVMPSAARVLGVDPGAVSGMPFIVA